MITRAAGPAYTLTSPSPPPHAARRDLARALSGPGSLALPHLYSDLAVSSGDLVVGVELEPARQRCDHDNSLVDSRELVTGHRHIVDVVELHVTHAVVPCDQPVAGRACSAAAAVGRLRALGHDALMDVRAVIVLQRPAEIIALDHDVRTGLPGIVVPRLDSVGVAVAGTPGHEIDR